MAVNFRIDSTNVDNDAVLLEPFKRAQVSNKSGAQLFIEYAKGFE